MRQINSWATLLLFLGMLSALSTVVASAVPMQRLACLTYTRFRLAGIKPARKIRLPQAVIKIDPSPDGRWMCCWASRPQSGDTFRLWMSPTSHARWSVKAIGTGVGSWSGDSRRYAFGIAANSINHGPGIAIVRPNEGSIKQLMLPFEFADKPSWSPDGKRLAIMTSLENGRHPFHYVSDDALANGRDTFRGIAQIVIIQFPSLSYTKILLSSIRDVDAVKWSPSGDSLAFANLTRVGVGPVNIVWLAGSFNGNLATACLLRQAFRS